MTTFDDKERIQLFRRTRHAKMQEIVPNLWLGSQETSHDQDLLQKHSITHLVTVMHTSIQDQGQPSQLASGKPYYKYFDEDKGLHRLIIPVEDRSTEDLMQYFPVSTEFISTAISSGGKVLVSLHGRGKSFTDRRIRISLGNISFLTFTSPRKDQGE
jgi:hypothetical protein